MKFNIDFAEFETISKSSEELIVGGFSSSFFAVQMADNPGDGETSNNCLGGNCANGCGAFSNIACNRVTGCGPNPNP